MKEFFLLLAGLISIFLISILIAITRIIKIKHVEREKTIDKAVNIILLSRDFCGFTQKEMKIIAKYLEDVIDNDTFKPTIYREENHIKNDHLTKKKTHKNQEGSLEYLYRFFFEEEIRRFCDNKENYKKTQEFVKHFNGFILENIKKLPARNR